MKIAVVALTAVVLALPLQEDGAFVLAVLNRDGVAQPFAAFTGRRWTAPWPDHLRTELPISLEAVPKTWWGIGEMPSRFSLWAHGEKTGEASVIGLAQIPALCSARIGVRTDYKSKAPAPLRLKQPYAKDGLLVSGNVPMGRIEMVERGSDEWNRAVPLITEEFNKGESRAIASFDGWRHPIRDAARRQHQITIEAMYKAPSDAPGWLTYFVEAVREYPPTNPWEDCGLTTTGQAWVHLGPSAKREVELSSRVTYCDRKGVNVMLPFGTVRAGNRTYWVYQFSGYEDEWYQIVRPEPKNIDVAVSFHAGSCPG
jgi:hypothetical protein